MSFTQKMDRTLKTLMLLVSLILLNSCAANVNFVYKRSVPELKTNLNEDPHVCIAIMSHDITDIKASLMKDFRRFVGKTVSIREITDEIVLSDDRRTIINHSAIALKYPKFQYLFVFYQNNPQITHDFYTRDETVQKIKKDGSTETRYTGYDMLVYVANFSIVCDTFLFDLRKNDFLAQASDTFTNQEKVERKELFPDHTLFGLLSDILATPKDDKERYPTITNASASSKYKYFYTFLNNVANDKR